METLRALAAFCRGLCRQWISLLTGGTVIAVVGVWEHYASNSVSWTIYAWLVVVFFVFSCFLAFRDQFILAKRLQTELGLANSLAANQTVKANDRHHAIMIEFEPKDPFMRQTVYPAGNSRFETYVRIRNVGNGFLSECVVSIVTITPKPANDKDYTILTPISSLAKGEHRYVLVGGFNKEITPGHQHIYNDAVTFAFATGGLWSGYTTIDPPPDDNPATIVIEAKALECQTERQAFRLWVAKDRRLWMAEA